MRDAEEKWSRFRVVLEFLQRLLGKKPAAPGDPYADVMALVRPALRGGAAQRGPRSKRILLRASHRGHELQTAYLFTAYLTCVRARFFPECPSTPLTNNICIMRSTLRARGWDLLPRIPT